MTEPTYLFDASSIVRALKEARLVPLGGQALQWLTVYEVINAFWKEAFLLHRLSLEEANSIINVFTELLRDMIILEPRGVEEETFKIAASKKITVYDASYIAIAAKHKLTLVTEDQKLSRKASDIVRVISFDELTR